MSISSHDVYIFLGPSLEHEVALSILPHVNYLDPVRCGDILSLLRYKPKIIGIIDGYFELTAAIWHKEILHALAHKVAVFGASSMGALRAAELHAFGMQGIGEIFRLYKDGIIEDDDEVALYHGPAKTKFIPLSEPFINIRITLEKMYKNKIISTNKKNKLIKIGKSIFYKERTLENIINKAQIKKLINPKTINIMRNWLTIHGFVDQKKLDAISLLLKINHQLTMPLPESICPTNRSMFIRALQHKIECESLPRHTIISSFHEKVAANSLALPKINKLITKYAYLLSVVYLLNTETPYSLEDWQKVEKKFQINWQHLHNCDNDFIISFLQRVKTIFLKSGIQCENQIDDETKLMLINLLKLSGQFSVLNTNFKNSILYTDSLLSFQEQLGKDWLIQLDCAKLWNVIYKQLRKNGLTPSNTTVQRYIEKFYRQRKITKKLDLIQWLKDNELNEKQLNDLMHIASYFDYVVARSNLDLLKINYPIEPNWWYRDALLLSGFYPDFK